MSKLDWIGKQYVVNHTDEVLFPLPERVLEAFSPCTAGFR
jgi:hypothetical protein